MADWRKVAKALALADGRIDEKEVAALDFLKEIQRGCKTSVQALDKLIADCERVRGT